MRLGDVYKRQLLLEDGGHLLHLLAEDLFRHLSLIQQDAVELEPLHPGQRAALVARALHEDRYAELFQLLLDLGVVEHHGVLDGEGAAGGKDALIVRGAVLARVGDAALLHGLSGLFHIPALGLRAGEGDAVQSVQMNEEVHHRGGDEINMIQRLA